MEVIFLNMVPVHAAGILFLFSPTECICHPLLHQSLVLVKEGGAPADQRAIPRPPYSSVSFHRCDADKPPSQASSPIDYHSVDAGLHLAVDFCKAPGLRLSIFDTWQSICVFPNKSNEK
ncbi:hypothetical protein BO86DRAFT_457064 [Aspergillus japonicus CBS 114.51]|uniref:Uncharacterized protein n=1 Tax=Aspergillus japonicus CBS 114.51 TaxID=1448312 RepID=A0A8T8WYY3_ASPJA|nr:hypothetical protein BO86DRAFT_457064 [Aspergillus japonicus CBS 114.51]RAH80612.1 hypothetical protein BO86DRAFT_457064 [Aspergillus japonicus CBS 114.51]